MLTPERLRPFADDARALAPDAFVVASYGKIVPPALLDLVPIAFNVHPSLLPLYRGATPIQSAIRDGRTETAVTIIAMDAGMDTGDVLLQERTPIGPDETYGELHDRLAQRGAELAVAAVGAYAGGTLRRTPQSEVARNLGITEDEIARTLTRPLRKEDLVIDWRQPRARVVDFVRSLAPQPLARTSFDGEESVKIVSVRPIEAYLPPLPGPSIGNGGEPMFLAQCGDDRPVLIERVIAPNRGPMTGEAYARRCFERLARKVRAT